MVVIPYYRVHWISQLSQSVFVAAVSLRIIPNQIAESYRRNRHPAFHQAVAIRFQIRKSLSLQSLIIPVTPWLGVANGQHRISPSTRSEFKQFKIKLFRSQGFVKARSP